MESYDLRDYKSVIRDAVKRETDSDPRWKWKVKAINKTEVRIGWGYLDFLGEKEPFRVTLSVMRWETGKEEDVYLTAYYPGDKSFNFYEDDGDLICLIGNRHWHDAKTIEDGLKMIIHNLATMAHNTF